MRKSAKIKILSAALIILSRAGAFAHISVPPPPAWTEAAIQNSSTDTVAFFKGPSGSSFIMTRLRPMDAKSHPAVLSFLIDVLNSLEEKTGIPLDLGSQLREVHFNNGIKALSLSAKADGKPRLILSVVSDGNKNYLALINSAIPELTLHSILRSIRTSPSEIESSPQTTSVDGQLLFQLPDNFHPQDISSSERNSGLVFSVSGLGSSLSIKKLSPQETPSPTDASEILKKNFKSLSSIDRWLISPEKNLTTPAGPELIYLSAGVKGEGALNAKALGYMPWCYWSYEVSAEGPRSEELIIAVFKSLTPGPSVIERLLKETPRLKASKNAFPSKAELILALVLTVLAAYFTFHYRKPKKSR